MESQMNEIQGSVLEGARVDVREKKKDEYKEKRAMKAWGEEEER